MEDYEIEGYRLLEKIGEGTYGDVYKVEDEKTKKEYAIKFIRFRDSSLVNGVSVSTIREMHFLKSTDHENIVKLYKIESPEINFSMQYTKLKPICMIMDYVDHDMWGLIQLAKEQKLPIYSDIHVKWYMYQLLKALDYLHKNMIIHRDLKTSNILVTNEHVIKLTDFGLARKLQLGDNRRYTNNVMTLWYRPPELLLGKTDYRTEADIWSAGCIFGELLTGSPIFPTRSDDEMEELHIIFKACGTPDDAVIRDLMENRGVHFNEYPANLQGYLQEKARVGKICSPKWITDEVMSLVLDMLQVVPSQRKSAEELLTHSYFDDVRDHVPDLPPFSLSLNTHRFQVKTPHGKKESVPLQPRVSDKLTDIQSMFSNLNIKVAAQDKRKEVNRPQTETETEGKTEPAMEDKEQRVEGQPNGRSRSRESQRGARTRYREDQRRVMRSRSRETPRNTKARSPVPSRRSISRSRSRDYQRRGVSRSPGYKRRSISRSRSRDYQRRGISRSFSRNYQRRNVSRSRSRDYQRRSISRSRSRGYQRRPLSRSRSYERDGRSPPRYRRRSFSRDYRSISPVRRDFSPRRNRSPGYQDTYRQRSRSRSRSRGYMGGRRDRSRSRDYYPPARFRSRDRRNSPPRRMRSRSPEYRRR